jgi:hypothetical protein
MSKEKDPANPSYYRKAKFQLYDVLAAYAPSKEVLESLGDPLILADWWQVGKYHGRMFHKGNPKEQLKKCLWYTFKLADKIGIDVANELKAFKGEDTNE